MVAANPWSNMKNASTDPSDEEFLQALINGGQLASSPAQPAIPAPMAKKVAKAVQAAAKPAPMAGKPVQQEQPGASAGTFRLPFQDQLTEDQQKEIALKQRAYFLDPTEMATRYAGIEKMPAIQDLKKGNQDYKDLIAMEARGGGQTDLSGLMALGDIASDNKYGLRAGYKVPGDKAKELLANMDKAQDNGRDLTKEIIALSNSGKAGMDTSTIQSLLLSKIAEGYKTAPPRSAGGSGNPVNNYDKWVRNTDGQFKKIDDTTGQINQIKTEIASGNPIDDSRIAILRATMDAHGRPNMAEVQMESGNRALMAKLPQAWERLATGKLTPENRQLYMDSFNTVLEYLNLERQMTAKRQRAMAKNYGVSESAANDRLPKDYVDKAKVKEAEKQAAPKSAREREIENLTQSTKEIMDFIKTQKGGQ